MPLYGLAEITLLVCAAPLGTGAVSRRHGDRMVVSSGTPKTGHSVLIVDHERCIPLAEGNEGEIWVHGPCVAMGYAGGTPEDAKTFQGRLATESEGRTEDAYLRTGDLGFFAEGNLFVTGRIKETLIVAGRKFHALDLEHTLRSGLPALAARPLLVVARRPEKALVGESLVCVVEWSPEQEDALPDGLFAQAARLLARGNEAPLAGLLLVPEKTLPRTDSGKLQRFAVTKALESGALPAWRSLSNLSAIPRTSRKPADLLPALVSAMAAELQVPASDIDVDATFAAQGLTSMAAYKVAARLEEAIGSAVPPTLFFENPTPREFADALGVLARAAVDVRPTITAVTVPAATVWSIAISAASRCGSGIASTIRSASATASAGDAATV